MEFKIIKPTQEILSKEIKNWRWKTKENKICNICSSNFKHGNVNKKDCGLCYLLIKCPLCGEWFEYHFSNSGRGYYIDLELKEKIIKNQTDDIKIYCSECIRKYNPGKCSNCGKENKYRDGANRGKDSYYIENSNDNNGCNCSYKFYLELNSSEEHKKSSARLANENFLPWKEQWKTIGGSCTICGKYNKNVDQNGRGNDENEWIYHGESLYDIKDNLIVKDGDICGCNCGYERRSEIITKIAKEKQEPGICTICGRDTRLDNPKSSRTSFGVCNICQGKIALKSIEVLREKVESGETDWAGIGSKEYRIFDKKIPCNEKCRYLESCLFKDINLKNKFGWCEWVLNHNGTNSLEWIKFNQNIECNKNCKQYNHCNCKNRLKNLWGYCEFSPNARIGTPNFITVDNIKYYLDRSKGQYVLWSEYIKYLDRRNNINIDIDNLSSNNFIDSIKNDYPNLNVFICKTFRTQESNSWNGLKRVFEEELRNNDVNWFTYIKFYIDSNGSINPLVVGKSGIKGSLFDSGKEKLTENDIIFSYNIEDGPSRLFLNENKDRGYDWLKTHVLIIGVNNEYQAFKVESEISEKYGLFES